jgi:carboxypeptidase Q
MRKNTPIAVLLALASPFALHAQSEKVDAAMMQKIRKEGLENSKVMDIVWNLSEKSGNRLTNSPGYFRAANYAKDALAGFGLTNAMLDPWGEFGKGWELEKSYVALTAPYYKPLLAYPKTWTAGTKGQKSAEVILINARDSAALEAYRGQLKGKIIMMDTTVAYKLSFKADADRYTDAELDKMTAAKPEAPRQFGGGFPGRGNGTPVATLLRNMAKAEGAVAILSNGGIRSHDGTIFAQGGGAYKGTDPENMLDIAMGIEDYNTIVRLVKSGSPVKLDVDVKTRFQTKDLQGYNVIAEIPGTDPTLKDEVVMLGAHLDSWQTGTGATDNAAGSAAMMEAVRILKAIGAQPKRTIRIALWSGEEQGLLGSRGYVKKTFADPADMKLLPAHEKLSTYFNIDNGTGKIRGIYLQGNEAARSIFQQWFEPFKDISNGAITISNTGGTDHQSFDAVGLPGFQFIQDGMEYNTRTHHSNMDVYDHLSGDDLKQIATIVAAFVYNAAQRDTKLPRKELPKPRTGGRGF